MAAARDVAGDLHVVGLVSEDQAGGRVAFHQLSEDHGISRIAANDAMDAELENVADDGDLSCCKVGLERPLLQRLGRVAENDVIGLIAAHDYIDPRRMVVQRYPMA
jgi:hypothetical protein